MNQALYMETTNKSAEQTISEIQILLRKHNLGRFQMIFSNDGKIESVYFSIRTKESEIPYKLPANHKPLMELAKQGKTKYLKPNDEEQAIKIAWRQIYRWIESQLALIQTQMVDIQEVFLPYMMVDNENTIYQKMLTNGFSGYLLKDSF